MQVSEPAARVRGMGIARIGVAQLASLVRAADAFDITPIVRLAKEPNRILRLLDIGAQGIHVPRCSTVERIESSNNASSNSYLPSKYW